MVPADLMRTAWMFHQQGQWEAAAKGYENVLAVQPNHPDALHLLGILRMQEGRAEEGTALLEQAARARPDAPDILGNYGIALAAVQRLEESIEATSKALALQPGNASTHELLGTLYRDAGDVTGAIACFRKALSLTPQLISAHSNLLFTLQFVPGTTRREIVEEAARWNERHAAGLQVEKNHPHSKQAHRKLRIGYVGADFRHHCLSLFTVPLLQHHDRNAFEVFVYSNVNRPDEITERIRGLVDVFRPIAGQSDDRVISTIRGDRVDVLVDISMHMAGNRLRVFARKPAPVQATWLAYPSTTGVRAIDYRLSDPHLEGSTPPDSYAERTMLLHTFWSYDPLTSIPPATAEGTGDGPIVFGCLNAFFKVNPRTLALWSRVLQAVPESRFILMAPHGPWRRNVITALGVPEDRVEFVTYRPRQAYLETYRRIDVALDTFPYNGHTTSLDALWMGVPVLSMTPPSDALPVARAGVSQLTNLGLQEWIAANEDDFVTKAVALASQPERRLGVRRGLRERIEKSPLMDHRAFARGMEDAYRRMWETWCATGT